MKIDILVNPDADHQKQAAAALAAGLRRHGDDGRIVFSAGDLRAPVVACWGWRKGEPLHQAGKRVLVMERGYVGDRFHWTSLGWDGLNGRARFPCLEEASELRWAHDLALAGVPSMAPKQGGDYALVLGQVTGDASILGVNIAGWYRQAARRLKEVTGLPVFFRAHPVEIERRGAKAAFAACGDVAAKNGSLEEALEGAAAVAAYNSNSLTDAVLAGVPVLAGDAGAMAWPVAGHGLDDVPRLEWPHTWAGHMAWCQWSDEEIANGDAWAALATCIEPGSGWSPGREARVPSFAEASAGA